MNEGDQLPLAGLGSSTGSASESSAAWGMGSTVGTPSSEGRPCPPLADLLRPRELEEVVGQEHLTGEGGVFRALLAAERVPSIVLWGPPGSGKTTLARVLGRHPGYAWEEFSAVLSGVKEVREVVARARLRLGQDGRRTLLFVDEIHRFNRAQQDAFLPHVEAGTITLIGATTENPSFQINAALLSRCQVYVLRELDEDALGRLADKALDHLGAPFVLEPAARIALLRLVAGDARRLLLSIETLAQTVPVGGIVGSEELGAQLAAGLSRRLGAEDHFDWASALQKSIRGSDPHAAVYWLTQMLAAGEDPRYLARRLVRMASEDVGLAEPGALAVALAAREAFEVLGSPEGHLALAECALYLALCPKSDSVYQAVGRAQSLLAGEGSRPVPLRLRNAPTPLLQRLGYGQGYRSAHDVPGRFVAESFLPEDYAGLRLYVPNASGRESRMAEDHARRTGGFFGGGTPPADSEHAEPGHPPAGDR